MILVVIGFLIALDNFHVDIFRYFWPALIIIAGIYLIVRQARKSGASGSQFNEFRVFGDTAQTEFSGEIDGTDISHFIGDTILNLGSVQLKPGINTLTISSFIGDIDVLVPENMAVEVHGSGAFGDIVLLNRKEGGIFVSVAEKTPDYDPAERKLRIKCSCFIGDIKVRAMSAASTG